MDDLTGMSDAQVREFAAKHARRLHQLNEKARRTAEKRKNAGLVSRTVHVPARFADQVAPTIERMIAELTQAEADQASSVVPSGAHIEWHPPHG